MIVVGVTDTLSLIYSKDYSEKFTFSVTEVLALKSRLEVLAARFVDGGIARCRGEK